VSAPPAWPLTNLAASVRPRPPYTLRRRGSRYVQHPPLCGAAYITPVIPIQQLSTSAQPKTLGLAGVDAFAA
jgi:hypothetical protein